MLHCRLTQYIPSHTTIQFMCCAVCCLRPSAHMATNMLDRATCRHRRIHRKKKHMRPLTSSKTNGWVTTVLGDTKCVFLTNLCSDDHSGQKLLRWSQFSTEGSPDSARLNGYATDMRAAPPRCMAKPSLDVTMYHDSVSCQSRLGSSRPCTL